MSTERCIYCGKEHDVHREEYQLFGQWLVVTDCPELKDEDVVTFEIDDDSGQVLNLGKQPRGVPS